MSEEAEPIPQTEGEDYPIEESVPQQLPPEQQKSQEESMDMGTVGDQGGMVSTEGATDSEVGMGVSGDAEMVGDAEGAAGAADNQQTIPPEFADEEVSEECKMFVGGLSWDTNETTLKDYFEKYGAVREVTVKYDRETQKSRGFAFVHFVEKESVDRVLEDGPHTLDEREIDVKKAIPHAQHQAMKNRTKKIFVGGVPTDMGKEVLEEYFGQFGEIEEVALVTEKGSTRRRGFIFVTYYSEDSVDKCTEISFHVVADSKVEVKRATPREQFPGGPGRGGNPGGGGGGGGMRGGGGGWGRGGGGRMPRGGGGGGGGGYGGGGGGGGGYGGGRPGWVPYGQYNYQHQYYYDGGYGGGYDQYGGQGGHFGGYGGQGGPQGGGRGGSGGYSRYGPVKSYNQHGGAAYHPYSR